MKKQNNHYSGFTLVELIVVITILAILGTIAFISLEGYASQARDSKRLSDIQNIKTSLELFSLNTGKYPTPDTGFDVTYDSDIVWTQGVVGDNVTTNLSRNLNSKPVDPLTDTEYTYSVIGSETQYELLSMYESDLVSYTSPQPSPQGEGARPFFVSSANAANQAYPKIDGTYNGVFVKTSKYYIPTPSIINSELDGIGGELSNENIDSQIITGGDNNIANGTNDAIIDGLLGLTVQAYSGIISDKNDDNKEDLAQSIIDAYSGTSLANKGIYKQIVETSGPENLVSLVDNIVLSSSISSSTGGGDESVTILQWKDLDSNCKIDDIHIPAGCVEGEDGCQIWAGCNSTLGEGVDFVSNHIYSCWNYLGIYNQLCNNSQNLGNSKEKLWNSIHGVDNIWGKLYNWSEITMGKSDRNGNIISVDNNTICPEGWYIPTELDWTILENKLFSGICAGSDIVREIGQPSNGIGYGCDGLGWLNNINKNEGNNLIQALRIPLSGYLHNDGITFLDRGRLGSLWSSTESSSNTIYGREIMYDKTKVANYELDKNRKYSVRCIKD